MRNHQDNPTNSNAENRFSEKEIQEIADKIQKSGIDPSEFIDLIELYGQEDRFDKQKEAIIENIRQSLYKYCEDQSVDDLHIDSIFEMFSILDMFIETSKQMKKAKEGYENTRVYKRAVDVLKSNYKFSDDEIKKFKELVTMQGRIFDDLNEV